MSSIKITQRPSLGPHLNRSDFTGYPYWFFEEGFSRFNCWSSVWKCLSVVERGCALSNSAVFFSVILVKVGFYIIYVRNGGCRVVKVWSS